MLRNSCLDCLLIFPPFIFPDGFYTKQRALDPPLMLMSLGAYIRGFGYSTKILDCNAEFNITDTEFEPYFIENYVNKYHRIKVIGFSATAPSVNASYRVAAICKKYYPDSIVVFGGAHASFVPDEVLDHESIDVVCIGEGEDTLKELLDGMPYGEIRGLAYKVEAKDGSLEIVKNKPRLRIKELDELPLPAYDLIDMKRYRPIIGNFKRLPAMMMVSSRGCPWSCNFCRRPVGRMWTYHSAKRLYEEFEYLSQQGIRDIAIMDDVFTVMKERVYELCQMLINKPLDIQWLCFARVDIVSPEMLKKMKQAGCWQIMYGVENFNQAILNSISKGIEIKQIYDAVEWAKQAKLEVRVCMIVGNVGDTEEIINSNIKLLNRLNPDYISVAILTPFPGHDIYNWGLKENRILTYDWDQYYGSTPILKLDTLTPDDIVRLYRKMTFSFYFRPAFIIGKLIKTVSFIELWRNAKGFFGLINFKIEKLLIKRKVDGTLSTSANTERTSKPEYIERLKKLTHTATKQTAIT